MSKFTSAIILAAGKGTRFGGEIPKQYINICGTPCLIHTIRAFDAAETVDEIILVGDEQSIRDCIEPYSFKKVSKIIAGGETRQKSSVLGFDSVNEKCKYVAIHDGARCLVTSEMIDKTVKCAYKNRAAAAAYAVSDTVKRAKPDGTVISTLDRNEIWTVQTPQVFEADIYRVSAYMAIRDRAEVTDDCMMAERLGFKIKLVDCGRENIKLTTPEDLFLCEAIMKERESRK